MPGEYYVKVVPAAPASTQHHVLIQIWNPSPSRTIQLLEFISCFRASLPANDQGYRLRRSTARGTPGSTVTPNAEHHARRQAPPASGFEIDLAAFTVQPTMTAENLSPVWCFEQVIGATAYQPLPRGIEIPPGTGLAFAQLSFGAQTGDWSFVIQEL